MVIPSIGSVVIIHFPFSDLSKSKLRPALILASVENDDWVLAQITSKSYADSKAVMLSRKDFSKGSLEVESYVRPGKLFTANNKLFYSNAGIITQDKFCEVIESVINVFTNSLKQKQVEKC